VIERAPCRCRLPCSCGAIWDCINSNGSEYEVAF
jgi:hypothetical protein